MVARYGGTVELLAGLLRSADVLVCRTAAFDRDEEVVVARILRAAVDEQQAVVTVLSPADPTLDRLRALSSDPPPVVAVTWHPRDEWPACASLVARAVPAGQISRDLASAVRAILPR